MVATACFTYVVVLQFFTKNSLGKEASEENHDLFWSNEQVMMKFEEYLELVISRTNTFSGVEYINDPTIFSWELGRNLCFSSPDAGGNDGTLLRNWMRRMVAHVRSLDSNHLVASGRQTLEEFLHRIHFDTCVYGIYNTCVWHLLNSPT